MKTKNKPGFIPLLRRFRSLIENGPAQRDSGISKLVDGLTSPTGLTEPPCAPAQRRSKMSNCAGAVKRAPAQRDSGNSILKTSPYRPLAVRLVPLCGDPYHPLDLKTTPAQLDSEMSNLGMGPIALMGHIDRKPVMKTSPAQRDSGISSLGVSRTGLTSPTGLAGLAGGLVEPQCTPAQQDSGMSILKAEFETSPAQRYSGNSNLGLGVLGILGILRSLGILGGKTKNENTPAQRDSVIYFWAIRLLSPSCPLDFKNRPAQPDSGMSNFGWMGRWGDESMGQQNLPDKLSGFHKRFF